MRTAVLAFTALLTVSIVACGGSADVSPRATSSGNAENADQDQRPLLAGGEFIDTKPIRGSSGGLVVIRGGLPGVVSRADAIVVAEILEVVDVTIPTRSAPPNFPVDQIEEDPLTTYSARVDQWIKGSGPGELLIAQFGGITASGPQFVDGYFLLQTGRTYILSLYTKHPDVADQADYLASVNGLGAFEVTDGYVHVLNHPMTQELQEQFGGMPVQEFVDVLRGYVANPPPSPTPLPAPPPQPPDSDAVAGTSLVIDTLAIDMDINDTPVNAATSLGSRKTCNTLARGRTLTIDITADAVAPLGEGKGGIIGFQFTLVYDPSKVKVAASDHDMLLAANSGSRLIPLGDVTPDADGSFLVAAADFGESTTPESGSGVLARITLEGVGPGVSVLELTRVVIADDSNQAYTIGNVLAAQVAVDAPCHP